MKRLVSGNRAMPQPGDVFSVKLPDGRHGAVRVLKTIGKSSLVYTSEYLGADRPSLDDPQLLKALMQKRFFFDGVPARQWLDGAPPKNFELVGCISPTDAEAEMECLVYGGKWGESAGNEAFLEWRWI